MPHLPDDRKMSLLHTLLLLKVLALSVLVISTRFESVAAKPVPRNNVSYDDESDDFDIGEPLTEKEFDSGISIKEGDESENFIPWGRKPVEQFDCDVNTQTGRKNFLSSRERWPDAKIPYEISATYTPEQRAIIAFSMKAFHNKTCIRFVRRTTEKNYIRIKKTGKGCWSDIGMTGLKQTVSLDDRCILSGAPGVVIHELMHALGFQHEHQRPDRDKYVSINIDNVDPTNRDYFEKMKIWDFRTTRFSYDYGSVMHYPANAFAKETGTPVIIPLRGKPPIGNRRNFSPLDLDRIRKLYCKSSNSTLTLHQE
ncbi:zinc metalloproteinase nas-8-like isoform X2 [Daphnia pulicaria]|uniref:zinc metalloproteinase nas-8-like isoform X2 n=1 Tax=Daphnia pulicaria TaxID=35523 RepID=UPI001EECA93C|nr:zinc metalloproteinase nas-8-like isoform X2 [Daphnia pulicaria]